MSVRNAKKPLILKRRMILKVPGANSNPIPKPINSGFTKSKLVNLPTIPLYREDIIFESKGESFLPGEYLSVTIINKLNNLTNNCKTIARYITRGEEIIEKTSDNLTQLIGTEGYNTLFHALCSVINQEYRIKAILSILTDNKPTLIQANLTPCLVSCVQTSDKACQTNETRLELKKITPRRMRKVLLPYVVKPEEVKVKKVTVNPFPGTLPRNVSKSNIEVKLEATENRANIIPIDLFKTEKVDPEHEQSISPGSEKSVLPDLGYLHDDDSNDSDKSFATVNTIKTTSELMFNPTSLVSNVDRFIKDQLVLPNYSIMLVDKTELRVPFKPEDDFHIATKENLQFLNDTNRKKLLLHQMRIDYKLCIHFIDGNLPIHLAVINDDVELLKRQCVVLKIRNQDVDILSENGLTALKLSLFRESAFSTNILLHHGADPFLADEEHNTCAHIAAELKTDHLSIILHHCKLNARNLILHYAEELQTPGWERKSDEDLGKTVLHHMCTLFDKSGHTPLMLASKLGLYENVRLLIESVPSSVHLAMPTNGNTALFLAVSAACTAAAEVGNKSKVLDHFRKTIELLLEAGADPSIDNNYNSNVNLLLQEFNCHELSILVANKVTYTKYFNGEEDYTKNFDKFLLMREGNTVSIKEMVSRKARSSKNVQNVVDSKIVKIEVDESVNDEGKLVINEVGNKLVTKKAGNKLVTKGAGNKLVTKDTDNKLVIHDTCNKLVTNDSCNQLVIHDTCNKLVTKDSCNKLVINDTCNKLVINDTCNKLVINDTCNKLVTNDACNKLVINDKCNRLVMNDTVNKFVTNKAGTKLVTRVAGTKLVTKDTGNKLVTKDAANKPVITENILINEITASCKIDKTNAKIESNINVKDYVIKPCKVDLVRNVICYPLKRKSESNKDDAKRSKDS